MTMNQEQLGLLLQIIGVGLFTPIILRWVLKFIRLMTFKISSFLIKMLRESSVGGPSFADIYLRTLDRLSTGTNWSDTAKLFAWSILTTLLFSVSLLGFLAFPVWGLNFLVWVPSWMQVTTWVLIFLLISDILIAGLWDFWLYHTQWGKNMIDYLSATSKLSYLLLNNPSKTRLLKKLVVSITFPLFYPIGGSILIILHLGVVVGGISERHANIGDRAGLIGWVLIIAGLILQLLS